MSSFHYPAQIQVYRLETVFTSFSEITGPHRCVASSVHRPKRKQHYWFCKKHKEETPEKETSDCDLSSSSLQSAFLEVDDTDTQSKGYGF